jgi:hypothetical protein
MADLKHMHYLLCVLLLSFVNIIMWDKLENPDEADDTSKNIYNGVSLMKAI